MVAMALYVRVRLCGCGSIGAARCSVAGPLGLHHRLRYRLLGARYGSAPPELLRFYSATLLSTLSNL